MNPADLRLSAYREVSLEYDHDPYVASLVKVDPGLFGKYSWASRTIKDHRKQIRTAFGARPPTEEDEERWTQWMADELCVLIALPDALRRRVVTCKR